MAAIQSRFEVAVPELPDHIDPASYSAYHEFLFTSLVADGALSDVLIVERWARAIALFRSPSRRLPCPCTSITSQLSQVEWILAYWRVSPPHPWL